ncbi:MAG: GDP-mannose 4,6-dehydratase [Candidatus Altiarchaeota archaeon]|nr:GDP-mannose 4,6-dehydratase [Candidatus Altiarchaeota archaeon]
MVDFWDGKGVLITGIGGFVGGYLAEELAGRGAEVFGVELKPGPSKFKTSRCDITSSGALERITKRTKPDIIFHLAAQTDVQGSFKDPEETYRINLLGTENVLKAAGKIDARVLFASTSEVYGNPERLPVREGDGIAPLSPYAISKAMGEQLCRFYTGAYDLSTVVTRAFNHMGPNMPGRYVFSSICRQVADVYGGRSDHLSLGNIDAERDFVDVRDVVKAYALVVEKGDGIYNVCSNKKISVRDLAKKALDLYGLKAEIRSDESKVKDVEVSVMLGDNSKIKKLGWRPGIDVEESLRDSMKDLI